MSREVDVSDPSNLSKEDAQYAFDRYMISGEQYLEIMGVTEDQSTSTPEEENDADYSDNDEFWIGEDPKNFSAQRVIQFLNSEACDDDEFARIIASEKNGKNRKTVVELSV